jgi:putative cell wall-binding protein
VRPTGGISALRAELRPPRPDHPARPLPIIGGVPRLALLCAALAALVLAGCSVTQSNGSGGAPNAPPAGGAQSGDKNAANQLGFPTSATKNTTRVAGGDAAADAAGVASAVFPATSPQTRPAAIALVDRGDWQGGVAASALAAAPVHAATLLTDGGSLPAVTATTLGRLQPTGATLPNRVQIVRVGDAPPAPSGLSSARIPGSDPYALAAAVDRFVSIARGKPSGNVVVASGERAAYAMPAAAWAARSGDAVLFTASDSLPGPTRAALVQHQKPNIYVLGPTSVIGTGVEAQLRRLGTVHRIQGPDPVQNAIAFARYKGAGFGFGQVVPGQNFVVANTSRPLDAAAAAPLASNGIFASLLLTDQAAVLPRALESYLLDVQPGFQNGDPSQGVFNHVWILGAGDAVSVAAQDEIDAATALIPVDQTSR